MDEDDGMDVDWELHEPAQAGSEAPPPAQTESAPAVARPAPGPALPPVQPGTARSDAAAPPPRAPPAPSLVEVAPNEYLALDTNVLISRLPLVKELYGHLVKMHRGCLLVPDKVLKELDGLKTSYSYNRVSGRDVEVGIAARAATMWMMTIVQEHLDKPHLRLETWTEVKAAMERHVPGGESARGDDMILACCLQFAAGGGRVVVWTDDKMLTLFAEANGVRVLGGNGITLRSLAEGAGASFDGYVGMDVDLPIDVVRYHNPTLAQTALNAIRVERERSAKRKTPSPPKSSAPLPSSGTVCPPRVRKMKSPTPPARATSLPPTRQNSVRMMSKSSSPPKTNAPLPPTGYSAEAESSLRQTINGGPQSHNSPRRNDSLDIDMDREPNSRRRQRGSGKGEKSPSPPAMPAASPLTAANLARAENSLRLAIDAPQPLRHAFQHYAVSSPEVEMNHDHADPWTTAYPAMAETSLRQFINAPPPGRSPTYSPDIDMEYATRHTSPPTQGYSADAEQSLRRAIDAAPQPDTSRYTYLSNLDMEYARLKAEASNRHSPPKTAKSMFDQDSGLAAAIAKVSAPPTATANVSVPSARPAPPASSSPPKAAPASAFPVAPPAAPSLATAPVKAELGQLFRPVVAQTATLLPSTLPPLPDTAEADAAVKALLTSLDQLDQTVGPRHQASRAIARCIAPCHTLLKFLGPAPPATSGQRPIRPAEAAEQLLMLAHELPSLGIQVPLGRWTALAQLVRSL